MRSPVVPVAGLIIALVFTGVAGAAAQDRPKRPKLHSDADTNHAGTYYSFGLDRIERSPREAAAAFYWASRIEPTWADPWYGQWVARLLSSRSTLSRYLEGRRRKAGSDLVSIDSLQFRALLLDPFVHRSMDRMLIKSYLKNQVERQIRREGGDPNRIDPGQLDFYLEGYIARNFDGAWQGWLAYNRGAFAEAIRLYTDALEDSDEPISLLLRLASVYYLVGNYTGARDALESVLSRTRELDDDELVIVYESKAMTEYYLGRVLERASDSTAAREAYARALVEDFSFYPAHVQLGQQALAIGDTLTGMSELQLAADISTDDVIPLYSLAYLSRETGQAETAAELFGQVIELEPFFALPYLLRAITLEELMRGEEALTHYEEFLTRAPRDDHRRGFAEQRAEVVRMALGRGASP